MVEAKSNSTSLGEDVEYTSLQVNFSIDDVRQNLDTKGFAIVDDVVGIDEIKELREFWLGHICRADEEVDVVWQS